MLEDDILAEAPGRRLRPGPNFAAPETNESADAVDMAVDRWAHGYAEEPSRAYDLTVRVLRLARAIEHGVSRAAGRLGLSSGELLLMDALYRLGPPFMIAPTALKRHFLISLAGIGKRVDRLESLGLIDRVPDEKDGRAMLVRLNKRGQNLLAQAVEADKTEPHIAWAMELIPEERAALSHILRRAQRRIGTAA
jgi:DNA-binding MarR family transcriptional regulator